MRRQPGGPAAPPRAIRPEFRGRVALLLEYSTWCVSGRNRSGSGAPSPRAALAASQQTSKKTRRSRRGGREEQRDRGSRWGLWRVVTGDGRRLLIGTLVAGDGGYQLMVFGGVGPPVGPTRGGRCQQQTPELGHAVDDTEQAAIAQRPATSPGRESSAVREPKRRHTSLGSPDVAVQTWHAKLGLRRRGPVQLHAPINYGGASAGGGRDPVCASAAPITRVLAQPRRDRRT